MLACQCYASTRSEILTIVKPLSPGESVSIQMLDGNETILRGPATITMVSQHTFPPVPMPVQVSIEHLLVMKFPNKLLHATVYLPSLGTAWPYGAANCR